VCYNLGNLISYGGEIMDVPALKAEIVKKGYTQEQIAKMIGITPKTFYLKMKKGEFKTLEAERMINILGIENPVEIFLTTKSL
jgi:transcriptional regulator, fis family